MPKPTNESCAKCKFYELENNRCLCHPPHTARIRRPGYGMEWVSQWPLCRPDDWCGEFKRK